MRENRVKAMCVAKNRDSKGYIIDYTLVDGRGNTVRMKSSEIKAKIRAGQLEVMNLKIDVAGRLIDAPKTEFKTKFRTAITAPAMKAPVQTTTVKPVEQQAPEKDILREWLEVGGMHAYISSYRKEYDIVNAVYDSSMQGRKDIPTPPVAEKFMTKIVDDLYTMAKQNGVKIIEDGDDEFEVPDSFKKLSRVVKIENSLEVFDLLKNKEDLAVLSCKDDYLVTSDLEQAKEFFELQEKKVTRWKRSVDCNKLGEVFFWKYIAEKFHVYNSDCEYAVTYKVEQLYTWMKGNKERIHEGSHPYDDYLKNPELMVYDFLNGTLLTIGRRTSNKTVKNIIDHMNKYFGMHIQKDLDDDASIISPIYLAVNYNIPYYTSKENQYKNEIMQVAKDLIHKLFINGNIESGTYDAEVDRIRSEINKEALSALDGGAGILIEDDGSISIIGANSTKLADCIKKNAVDYRDKNLNDYVNRDFNLYGNYADFVAKYLTDISRLPGIKSLYNTYSNKTVYLTKGYMQDLQDAIKSILVDRLLDNDRELVDEDNVYTQFPEEVVMNFKKIIKITQYNADGTPEESEIPDDILDEAYKEYKKQSIFNFDEE